MGTEERDDLDAGPELLHRPAAPAPPPPGGAPPRVIDIRHLEPDAADPELRPYLTGRLLTRPEDVSAARALHAAVFVERGWLPPETVGEDGAFRPEVDPWAASAAWFGSVRAGAVQAVARTLSSADPGVLPVFGLAGIPDGVRRSLLGVRPAALVEVSALARRAGAARTDAPAVIAGLWRESVRRGHEVWVMAVDVAVFGMLRRRVVGTSMEAIGPEQPYLGSPVVPAVLRLDDLLPAQAALARSYTGDDPLPTLLPRLFPAAPGVRR